MASKYHVIRFVLAAHDDAVVVHGSDDTSFWRSWFRSVSRMFSGRIPPALLDAMSSRGDHLRSLASEHKPAKDPARLAVERLNAWIERRDRGNRLAIEKRKARNAAEVAESVASFDARYHEQMLPLWSKDVQDIVQQRAEQLRELGIQ